MAEHMNQETEAPLGGFNAMGHPIPSTRRQAAYSAARSMGLEQAKAWECVNGMAEQLERDAPYQAQKVGMRHVDLTGAYRLMAQLLTDSDGGES